MFSTVKTRAIPANDDALLAAVSVVVVFAVFARGLATPVDGSAAGFVREPNVVLLVADDLRDLSSSSRRLYVPNYERLASRGVVFENAFAQQAVCAPSRNSFLTGRRPDTLHLYDFYSYWRDFSGNFTTLPQFFKENGYRTYSFGKVFHPGKSSNFTDDYPYSWSEPTYHPSTEIYKQSKVCVDEETEKPSRNLVCPVDIKDQPEGTLPDIQTTNAAIQKLNELNNSSNEKPYFVAIGFHKPHIPLKFPQEYLKYYPIENVSLPNMPFRPSSLPTVAWNPWLDVKERDDIKRLNISFPYGQIPDVWSLKIRQSYYAAVTYIDDQIGKLLKHIDFENTIIVFMSDHGWSLGEHGEWSKFSNYDVSLKVPLLIVAPQYKHSFSNVKSKDIVELVDVFPTLAELSGIVKKFPKCKKNVFQKVCSEGKSLVPIMKSLIGKKKRKYKSDHKHFAFSQYPRPGIHPTIRPNSDKPKLHEIKIMGYTVRTSRYRYTEWVGFNHTIFKPDWNKIYGKEFYDHYIDSEENLNLDNRKELNHIQKYLSKQLKKFH